MNTLVETIQKIGIFLIAAQAIMHFAPGTAYTKYIKMIVSIIVLVLFLSPVYQIITGDMIFSSLDEGRYEIAGERVEAQGLSMSWEEMEAYIEKQTWKQETVIEQMEDEIKSRLNDEIEKMYAQSNNNIPGRTSKYEVTNVIIKGMEPVFLRIVVYRSDSFPGTGSKGYPDRENKSEDDAVKIDTIQILGIVIGDNGPIDGNDRTDEIQEEVSDDTEPDMNFKQWFADILGLEQDRVEVIVYGED